MIGLPAGVKVFRACGATDMRKGMDGLAVQVQTILRQDPFSGHVFVSQAARRSREGALLGHAGPVPFAKRLDQGRFIRPSPADRVAYLTAAQLATLLEEVDWRAPRWTWCPALSG